MNDNVLGMLPLLLLIAVMVWMIVSQRRRQREVAQMQSALAVGEEVLTVGGVIGRLTSVDGPIVGLEVSDGVVIRVDRRTISGRTSDVPAFGVATTAPSQVQRHGDTVSDTTSEQAAGSSAIDPVDPTDPTRPREQG